MTIATVHGGIVKRSYREQARGRVRLINIDESIVQLSRQEAEYLSPIYKGLATRFIYAMRSAAVTSSPSSRQMNQMAEKKNTGSAIYQVLSFFWSHKSESGPVADLAVVPPSDSQLPEPEFGPLAIPSEYSAALAIWRKYDDGDLLIHHGEIRRVFRDLLHGLKFNASPSSRDSEEVEQLALRVMAIPEQRLKLRALSGEKAQDILDLLIQIVDKFPQAPHNFDLNREIRKIAHVSGRIPRMLFLSEVVCKSTNPVGIGGFGDVFFGRYLQKPVAVKRLRVPQSTVSEGMEKELFYEALLWRELKHPNILEFLGVSRDVHGPFYSLVSPWMASGDVHTYLRSQPQADRPTLIKGVAEGLRYLHERTPPVVHADLRGGNILVNDRGEAQLCDFGLARIVRRHSTTTAATNTNQRGTFRWMAPELILNESEHHSTASDVWAFGCVCLEIFAQVGPYDDTSEKNEALVLVSISRGVKPCLKQPQHMMKVSSAMWGLMNDCWERDPDTRPAMATLVVDMHAT